MVKGNLRDIGLQFLRFGASFQPLPVLLKGLVAGLDRLLKGLKLAPIKGELPPELRLSFLGELRKKQGTTLFTAVMMLNGTTEKAKKEDRGSSMPT